MTSTAIDAIVAIALIGAAIATVSGTLGPTAGTPAPDPTLETLATGTTAVTYTQSAKPNSTGSGVNDPVAWNRTESATVERTVSGTYVGLLRRAAVSTLTVDGRPATALGSDFRDATEAATRNAIGARTQIVVRWRPYRGSHLSADLAVGPTPPPNADLSAASMRVESGFAENESDAQSAAAVSGYTGVSRVVADRIVAGLFPIARTAPALRSGYPVAALTAHRYYRFGNAYGVDLEGPVSDRRPGDANDRLAAGLADRIETDLRREFASPEAAARAIEIDHVDVVVRRWA